MKKQSIPKIIHYCWLSDDLVPEELQDYMKSWKKLKGYEFIKWDRNRFNLNDFPFAKQAFEAKKYAYAADVVRLFALYNYGGIYLDMDIEVLKSFDDLLDNDLMLATEFDDWGIEAGCMGATKNHPYIKKCLDYFSYKEFVYDENIMVLPSLMRQTMDNYFPELVSNLKTKDYFTVKDWWTGLPKITKDSYVVHHYNGSWKSKDERKIILDRWDFFTNHGKVSVIIPIYGVEKYLPECIDSIISQTYTNLEIILIDDKSPDKSGKIADDYAERDKRIKVIHKPKNEGLNMARATGFKESSGDFVIFVDSDDLLKSDCILKTLLELNKHKVDMVRFGTKVFKDGQINELTEVDETEEVSITLTGKRNLYKTQLVGVSGITSHLMTVWGGLYKRETVEKIEWKKSNFRAYEDNFWTIQLLENTKTAFYSNRVGYCYRCNDADAGVLSKRFTGNRFNGESVGYLEYVSVLVQEYIRVSKKYKLGLHEEIDQFARHQWSYRITQLYNYEPEAIMVENNTTFLLEGMPYFIDSYNLGLKEQAHADMLKRKIIQKDEDINRLNNELSSFLSIKRSAKLLLGNIKRRLKSYMP